MDAPTGVVTVGPDGGRRLGRYTGGELLVKVPSGDNGAPITIIESRRELGEMAGPPRHRQEFLEIFYVVEGGYDFEVEGEHIHLSAGGLVQIPPLAAHSFKSDGRGRSRLLTIAIPGGLDRFFEEAAALGTGAEMTDELREVGRRHGIEFLV
jgi:mannose-6-phosphate isomerase-like protein (cupin superfamily)